jgi:hypothetical protein
MGLSDLTYVMAAESLANERIDQTNPQGPTPCQIAVQRSARHIREAIEGSRRPGLENGERSFIAHRAPLPVAVISRRVAQRQDLK